MDRAAGYYDLDRRDFADIGKVGGHLKVGRADGRLDIGDGGLVFGFDDWRDGRIDLLETASLQVRRSLPGHAGGALTGIVLAALLVDQAVSYGEEVSLPVIDFMGILALAVLIAGSFVTTMALVRH